MTDEPVTDAMEGQGEVARISSVRVGAAMLVTIAGELDMLTTPTMREHLTRSIAEAGDGPVVLDLSEVSFAGSSGMSLLAGAVRERGNELGPFRVVVGQSRAVTRSLQITGLDQILALFHDVPGALSASVDDDGDIPA